MSTPAKALSRRQTRPAPLRPGVAVRTVATEIYANIVDRHQALDHQIDPSSGNAKFREFDARDRRLVHAIAATALRRHGEVTAALDRLIEKKLPRRTGNLRHILEIAATQILFMDSADHAIVSVALEQVTADRDARHFKGLANAVLRRLARERDEIRASLDAPRLDTPDWLWQRWADAYGEATARQIAEAHLLEPTLDLTVKSDPDQWAKRLDGVVLPTGSVRFVAKGPVDGLPGYADGEWWVQDAAATLPARLIGPVSGKRVADLCAAPGGKTAALAAACGIVTAVDASRDRLGRLRANLARLKLTAETVAADIFDWRPTEPFDAILLDAPCSATGTIRRHPDIAHLKSPEDIATLAALQAKMMDSAVVMLKPGGTLVYCTCSLEPEEGELQFKNALARHDLTPWPVRPEEIGGLAEAVTPEGWVRTLPSHLPAADPRLSGLDGFFIGRCRKK